MKGSEEILSSLLATTVCAQMFQEACGGLHCCLPRAVCKRAWPSHSRHPEEHEEESANGTLAMASGAPAACTVGCIGDTFVDPSFDPGWDTKLDFLQRSKGLATDLVPEQRKPARSGKTGVRVLALWVDSCHLTFCANVGISTNDLVFVSAVELMLSIFLNAFQHKRRSVLLHLLCLSSISVCTEQGQASMRWGKGSGPSKFQFTLSFSWGSKDVLPSWRWPARGGGGGGCEEATSPFPTRLWG